MKTRPAKREAADRPACRQGSSGSNEEAALKHGERGTDLFQSTCSNRTGSYSWPPLTNAARSGLYAALARKNKYN